MSISMQNFKLQYHYIYLSKNAHTAIYSSYLINLSFRIRTLISNRMQVFLFLFFPSFHISASLSVSSHFLDLVQTCTVAPLLDTVHREQLTHYFSQMACHNIPLSAGLTLLSPQRSSTGGSGCPEQQTFLSYPHFDQLLGYIRMKRGRAAVR